MIDRPGRRCLLRVLIFVSVLASPLFSAAQDFSVQSVIHVGASPQYAAISPDGSRLFVANFGGSDISVIDTRTGEILKPIQVGHSPHGLLLSHDGRLLYVLVNGDGSDDCAATGTGNEIKVSVVAVDTAQLTIVRTIQFAGRTDAMALTPDDKSLYVARVCREVDSIDLSSQDPRPLPSRESINNPGGLPVGILISPDGRRMFVNYQGGGPYQAGAGYTLAHDALVEYDLQSGEIVKLQNSLPNVGDQIALSPDGLQLWSNGVDACSRPDYPHAGCPSVPSRVVNALQVSRDPNQTLAPLRKFGFSLDEFNGRISIAPSGEVFVGGGIYLKRIDPKALETVQRLEIAGAGDVVFSRDGQTAYVTVSERNEVDVLARNKPGNAEASSEAAALPLSTVDAVLLLKNCVPGQPCDACARSGTCSAERTPTELPASVIGKAFTDRGIILEAGKPPRKLSSIHEDWPCIYPIPDGVATDEEARRLLDFIGDKEHYARSEFEGQATDAAVKFQPIAVPVSQLSDVTQFRKTLRDAVYLTTIVCHDRVQTALFQSLGETIVASAKDEDGKPISGDQVQDLVYELRGMLNNPCSTLDDIKKAGSALYRIIFPPLILQALAQKQPNLTLAWAARDQLRDIPLGALWDGNEFLLEKYSISLETPYSAWPSETGNLVALAAGDSRGDPNNKLEPLPPLDGVRNEIMNSFASAGADNSKIPAVILLDGGSSNTETFSPQNLQTQLQALVQKNQDQRPIVHIASHFVLKNTAKDTYLLTQSGPLRFSEFSDRKLYSLDGVWLLTLSACHTAGVLAPQSPGANTSNAAVESEAQSLASVADADGALSTVATLWDVADQSTSQLMQQFYSNIRGGNSKGEALRQAQLSLLGNYRAQSQDSGAACSHSYDHPYYWAPFVLIGDWH